MEEEGEEVLKDNIMHDIKEGFIQRRLPDGGFKVGVKSVGYKCGRNRVGLGLLLVLIFTFLWVLLKKN